MTTVSRRKGAALLGALAVGAGVLAAYSPAAAAEEPGGEPYRQNLHYSPAKNWVNDPNGMIYYKGTYHLFYQHNPSGDQWGNMSWGHATSTDLVSWTEQPVAIPNTETEFIFSGSTVVDWKNTSGLGTADNPPMVAIYTSDYRNHPVHGTKEATSLAYSLDAGMTWTKYSGNPVDDRSRRDYRDPKVFWYGDEDTGYWVSVTVEADASRVVINRSDNLIDWTELSVFTSSSLGGFWECPDLYPIALDGDPAKQKWVLALSTQASRQSYLVGDFDGTTFTEDPAPRTPIPQGTALGAFDGEDYEGWAVENDPVSDAGGAFGSAPATGTLPQQQPVTEFAGTGYVNSYLGTDRAIGRLVSPDFTIDADSLSFLIGGGHHPREEGTGSGAAPDGSTPIFDFELPEGETLADHGWTGTGDFDPGQQPAGPHGGDNVAWGFGGTGFLSTFYSPDGSDARRGTLTSPEFEIGSPYIDLKVGGGDGAQLAVQLLVDGEVVKSETGKRNHLTDWRSWDVSAYRGATAQIRVVDDKSSDWAAIWIDDVVAADSPALPRSTETTVSLVVDGETVRSTTGEGRTGADTETMNWASWDVSEFAGRSARIEVVDNNRGGWGHILADQFTLRDDRVPPAVRLDTRRLDFGADNYAASSFNPNENPDGERIFVGWMGQAFSAPTSPWRGSFTMPRELALKTVDGTPMIVHSFAHQLADYEKNAFTTSRKAVVVDGEVALPEASGTLQRIRLTLEPGAGQSGITVRGGDGKGTRIGYDAATHSVFIDRSRSGLIPSDRFTQPSRTPVRLIDGKVSFDILVDTGSVEVLVNGGEQAFSEFIYPDASQTAVSLFSTEGSAKIETVSVAPLFRGMYPADEPGAPSDTDARAVPAQGVLSSDNGWDTGLADGDFDVTMNLWWGENASLFRLYRDGELVHAGQLKAASPTAQKAVVPVRGLPNGTYTFIGELVNSKGASVTKPLTVKVTEANPGVPVLSHDNHDGDGAYRVTANLWWGQNATSYVFRENGEVVGEGTLKAATPSAQKATLDVTGRAKGSYVYTVEFRNAAGTTESRPLTVTVRK
ncbi:GH32 C-terminal domain-containing protein [Microbacterium rhizophilus]|uniref:GH32 C-terminal domain-containing protein n=1 Tax=Microbacterium rhizophilus TaxID=3138934 RepID=UPI0031E68513